MSRNLRNAAFAFSQKALGAVAGAVGMFFVARQMPNAEFHVGVVGFALSFVGMFLAIQRAFDDAHTKRISEGQPLAACNSTYLLLNVVATAAMALMVLGGIFVWTDVLGRGFQTDLHIRALQLLVVYQVLNSVGEYVRRTYEGQQNIIVGQIILSTEHVIKGMATVYVAFFGLDPLIAGARNAVGLAGAYVIGAAALALIAILLMIGQPFGRPSWSLAKHYARYGLQTSATATITMVATNAGAVLLQLFWGASDVGYYFAPHRYLQFLPAAAGALTTSFFPVFSAMHAEGRTAPRTVERMTRLVLLVLLPVLAVSVVLPDGIIHVLLSDRFLPGAPVMAILAGAFFLKAISTTVGSKLLGINKPEEVTRASILSMVVMLVLGVVLVAPSLFGIPLFGLRAKGAALAFLVAELVATTQVLQATHKHADVSLWNIRANVARQGVMFAGTALALWGLTFVVEPTSFRIYHLLGAGVLALVVFYAIGLAIREVTRQDVAQARELLHPIEFLRHVKEETSRSGRRRQREEDPEEDDES